jgi:large subunit ribosomal protein L30
VAKLIITLVKSAIGYPEDQKRTVQALGLKKLNQSVELEDSGSVRGMAIKVRHLVKMEVSEVSEGTRTRRKAKKAPTEEKTA